MSLIDNLKNLAAAGGVIASLATGWTWAGLPVPATQTYVNIQTTALRKDIAAVNVSVKENQLSTVGLSKNSLFLELRAIQKSLLEESDSSSRAAFERRAENIKSEIDRIVRQEQRLENQIEAAKGQ